MKVYVINQSECEITSEGVYLSFERAVNDAKSLLASLKHEYTSESAEEGIYIEEKETYNSYEGSFTANGLDIYVTVTEHTVL